MGTYRVGIAAATGVALLALAAFLLLREQNADKIRLSILQSLPDMPAKAENDPRFLRTYNEALGSIQTGGEPLEGAAKIARMYQANGYIAEAIQCMAKLQELDAGNPKWPYFLGFNLAGYGELEEAIKLWDRAAKLNPEYLAIRIRQAEAYIKLNRLDRAGTSLAEVLSRESRNPHALQAMGRIEVMQGRNSEAVSLLKKAMAYSKDRVGVQLLVTVLDKLGKIQEADAIRSTAQALEQYAPIPDSWMDDLLDDCYDPALLLTGGGLAMYAGDPDRGIQLLNRLISYEPDNSMAYHQLGVIHRSLREWPQAIKAFDKATKLDPSLSDSWLFQAIILRDLGQIHEGDRKMRKGLVENPNSPALHLLQGQVYAERRQNALAKRSFRKSISLRPQEVDAYNELGRLLLLEGNLQQAKETILASLDAETSNPVALSLMVLISIQANDQPQAELWYEEVLKQPRIIPLERKQLRQFIDKKFGKGLSQAAMDMPLLTSSAKRPTIRFQQTQLLHPAVKVYQCWDDRVEDCIRPIGVLRRHGAKALFKLNPILCEERRQGWFDASRSKQVDRLSLSELSGIYEGFTIANHSSTHLWPSRVATDVWKREVEDGPRTLQCMLQQETLGFAYPFGEHNAEVESVVAEAGHAYARTVEQRNPRWPA